MQPRRVIALLAIVAFVGGGCGSILPSTAPTGSPATVEALIGEWSAVPLRVASDLREDMDRACREGPGMALDRAFEIPVVHARGRGRADVVYSNGSDVIACHLSVSDPQAPVVVDTTNVADALPVDANSVMLLATTSTDAGPLSTMSVIGVTGSSVARVRAVPDEGGAVEAALGGGVFAVWWPGGRGGTIQGLDPAGEVVAEVAV